MKMEYVNYAITHVTCVMVAYRQIALGVMETNLITEL